MLLDVDLIFDSCGGSIDGIIHQSCPLDDSRKDIEMFYLMLSLNYEVENCSGDLSEEEKEALKLKYENFLTELCASYDC